MQSKAWITAALLSACVLSSAVHAFSSSEKQEIEQIVHSYLVNHPEVIIEAAQTLKARDEAAAAEKLQATAQFFLNDSNTPKRGDPKAEHYVIEFSDYNCGYCKYIRPMTQRLFKEENVRFAYVEFPILGEMSLKAAAAGLALLRINPDQYFIYHDYLMDQRHSIKSDDEIKKALQEAGASWDQVRKVMAQGKVQEQLADNIRRGRELGVNGTPYFIIDGKELKGAVKDYESLRAFLRQ